MFCALAREHGNFIVGRKTYEAVKNWDEGFGFDDLKGIKKVVISQDRNYQLGDEYILASSPEDALLKLSGSHSALVVGGSAINTAFITANLIDEIILNVEPALIGSGIPLFAKGDFLKKLELVSSEKTEGGIVTLRYNVRE